MPYADPEKQREYKRKWRRQPNRAVPYNPHRWWFGITYSQNLDPDLLILFRRMESVRAGIHEVSRRSGVGVKTIQQWAVGLYKPRSRATYEAVCESVGLLWENGNARYIDYFVIGSVRHFVHIPYRSDNPYHKAGTANVNNKYS